MPDLERRVDALETTMQQLAHRVESGQGAHSFALQQVHLAVADVQQRTARLEAGQQRIENTLDEILRRLPE